MSSELAQWPQADVRLNGERGRVFQSGQYVSGALFTGQAEVSFDLDLWRRLANLSEAARAELLANEYAQRSVRMSLIGDVATAYFTLLALDQQLDITQRTVATRKRFLQLTQSKFRHGAASRLDVNRAEARRQQALLHYQGAVAQAFREVSDALAARQRYAEYAAAQAQQVDALRQASERVLRRYEKGYSSYFEVIDANATLFAAELQLTQALRNNLVALTRLYQALGGGWQR